MSIPPIIVATTRKGLRCQWNLLMNGLGPADKNGHYKRPKSKHADATLPSIDELFKRGQNELPYLVVGKSCPWAHRTWLVYRIRHLEKVINLVLATPDQKGGRWTIEPSLLGCSSLKRLYKLCKASKDERATVPVLIDPLNSNKLSPRILGNESAQLIKVLNAIDTKKDDINLMPEDLRNEIEVWQNLLQDNINNGVYKCGFARNQKAYEKASNKLFSTLEKVESSLAIKGPWLCGERITLADIQLFPTLIRWEMVYVQLFKCSEKPLWSYPNIWAWRQKFLLIEGVRETCNPENWRNDYFGALFPLNPSNIIPKGPDLMKIVNAKQPTIT